MWTFWFLLATEARMPHPPMPRYFEIISLSNVAWVSLLQAWDSHNLCQQNISTWDVRFLTDIKHFFPPVFQWGRVRWRPQTSWAARGTCSPWTASPTRAAAAKWRRCGGGGSCPGGCAAVRLEYKRKMITVIFHTATLVEWKAQNILQ